MPGVDKGDDITTYEGKGGYVLVDAAELAALLADAERYRWLRDRIVRGKCSLDLSNSVRRLVIEGSTEEVIDQIVDLYRG